MALVGQRELAVIEVLERIARELHADIAARMAGGAELEPGSLKLSKRKMVTVSVIDKMASRERLK